MPFYEYQCRDCGRVFDKYVRSILSRFEVTCPDCGSERCEKNVSLFGTSGASRGSSNASAGACAPSG
jgi:putative FmdB family regulatory protein